MELSTPEQWRPIPGFEGVYSASSLGRIRSEHRTMIRKDGSPCTTAERILKTRLNRGYPCVTLKKPNGPYVQGPVHHWVALAFLGVPPEGLEVCHNNGDRTDARLSNLRYDTHVNNIADKKSHGTQTYGERHSRAKLTDRQVVEIRKLCVIGGMTQSQIAALYGVSREWVNGIHRRRLRRDAA